MRKLTAYIPKTAMVFAALALIALGVNLGYTNHPGFADWFNRYISGNLRAVTATLTAWIPFSLAECLLISSPVLVAVITLFLTKRASVGKQAFIRCITGVLSVLLLVYFLFVFLFGAGYHTTPLDQRIGIPREKVSKEELYETTLHVIRQLNELEDQVMFVETTGSVRPYSHKKTVELCTESYAALSERYGFIKKLKAPVKQIVLSEYMTYTHISGVYTFFTGEANLNTNYPDFVNVYTTAHEMAHQRGIAREDEANFIAYLVCISSEDPYMRYAGYLNMYEYLASPLYKASPTLYREAVTQLDSRVRYDLACYSDFFEKYRENVAAEVSDTVNNTYLVIQGTEGSKSYGMVVDLAVAYHKAELSGAELP